MNPQLEIPRREMVIGFRAGDHMELSNLSSFLIGGQTGTGKSVLIAHLCCHAVMAGSQLLVIDPHLNEKKHGLMHKIEPLQDWFAREPVDFEDISQVVERFEWLAGEYQQRKARDGMVGKSPLVLVIDEFNELLGEFDKHEAKFVAHTIGNIARGGRKFGMFVLLCAHNWNLSSTGGSDVRKNVPGRICMDCESSEMAMILNTDAKLVGHYATPPLRKGEAIVKQPGFGMSRLRYPLMEREDCEAIAGMVRRVRSAFRLDGIPLISKNACIDMHGKDGTGCEPSQKKEADGSENVRGETRCLRQADVLVKRMHAGGEYRSDAGDASGDAVGYAPGGSVAFRGGRSEERRKAIVEAGKRQLNETGYVVRTKIRDELGLDNDSGYELIKQVCNEQGWDYRMKSRRMSEEEWEELKQQHSYTCLCCKRREPDIKLTRDHVVPISRNGTWALSNVQPLCLSCNSSKGDNATDYR
jgi:hypothetical protein